VMAKIILMETTIKIAPTRYMFFRSLSRSGGVLHRPY
jgi:hypothetical protein